MSVVQPADFQDREESVTTEDHAFVWASAGTGKTHTLTLRALFLIFSLVDPVLYSTKSRNQVFQAARKVLRSIVLATFTRKAASEMQVRLHSYLDLIARTETFKELKDSAQGAKDPLFIRTLEALISKKAISSYSSLWKASQVLVSVASELQICTLHSFAASILRRYPIESGIPPFARFAREDEDDLKDLNRELIDYWWQVEAIENPGTVELLTKLTAKLRISQIDSWLQQVVRYRWLPEELEKHLEMPGQDPSQVIEALGEFARTLKRSTGRAKKAMRLGYELEQQLLQAEAGTPKSWLAICRFLAENGDYLFTGRNKTVEDQFNELSERNRATLSDMAVLAHTALRQGILGRHDSIWPEWIQLLRGFSSWVADASIRLLGLVTFDDMIRASVQLLEQFPSVREREIHRLKALLIDEFQDTDNDQLRLIELLFRKSTESNHEILGFFVGDTKQSIYRFRGADVDSTIRFFRDFKTISRTSRPIRTFHLTTSFRSTSSVTNFVNQLFSNAFQLAGPEESLVPFRQESAPTPTWITMEPGRSKFKKNQALSWAARTAVKIVKDSIESDSSARLEDFLVLTRNNTELDIVVSEFQKHSVAIVSTGAQTFYRNPEVMDAINLLIALHNPLDRVAVAILLRSPIIGLSPHQIFELFEKIGPEQLFFSEEQLPNWLEENGSFSRIVQIRDLVHCRRSMLLTDWLIEVRRLIPTSYYLAREDREGRSYSRIDKFFKNFQEVYDDCLEPPLAWLMKQRTRIQQESRRDVSLGEDVVIFDETINAVRIMTIHKAKGLQGKKVIVFGWSSLMNEIENPIHEKPSVSEIRDQNGTLHRGFDLKWDGLPLVSLNWRQITAEEFRQSLSEAIRLAYVATTRAETDLYCIQPTWEKLKLPDSVVKFSSQKKTKCFRKVEPPFHFPNLPADKVKMKSSENFRFEEYREYWFLLQNRLTRRKLLVSPSDYEVKEASQYMEIRRSKDTRDSSSFRIGELVHVYLEKFLDDTSGGSSLLSRGPDQARFHQTILGRLKEMQSSLGFNDLIACRSASRILERFLAGELKDPWDVPYIERVRKGAVLAREYPFFLRDNDQNWHGVIDLVLRERDGIKVVDFKTGIRPQPLPEFYLKQAKVYKSVIQQLMQNEKVEFEFWWLSPSVET